MIFLCGKFYGNGTQAEYDKFGNTVLGEPAVRQINDVDWKDCRFDSSSSNPDYIGLNETASADTSSDDWVIFKFTYDGSDNKTRIQRAKGAWDDRVSLFS